MFLRCITKDMGAILKSDIFQHCPSNIYLAGGTAVALYFGHRLSVDLDFFTDEEFDSLVLSSTISTIMEPGFKVSRAKMSKNTVVVNLNETGFSLFSYSYPLLAPLTSMQNIPVQIASQLDLTLMKLVAINQRGSCKDFLDLRALLEKNRYPFAFLMDKFRDKYGIGDDMHLHLKKSLVYFDDAEKDLNIQMYNDQSQVFENLGKDAWEETKSFFERFVLRR